MRLWASANFFNDEIMRKWRKKFASADEAEIDDEKEEKPKGDAEVSVF